MRSSRPYAIITARGGSKRIPKKNIRDFYGKPIIAYSIEAALGSGLFDEVMVSTDSEEIAEVGKKYGASVPFMRSEKTSNDFAGTADVLHEVIGMYGERGVGFDAFCCIYPTAPFVTAEKLRASYGLLQDESVCSVVTMAPFSFPPQRGMLCGEDGFLEPVDGAALGARSQDLPTVYHDCGQFYWVKTAEFLKSRRILCSHTVPFIVSEMEAQDIDNETDWRIAEMKFRLAGLGGGK